MRILFISRRFFPAVSGMSVYAQNLLRELVEMGHDVTMISQFRGDEAGTRVYGGGPPPPLEGVKIIGLEALGEQEPGLACWEKDIETMVRAGLREHEAKPFDIVHAQYGYPTGLAALEFSRRTGIPNVVSIQGGDGHWVGPCCETHRLAMRAVLDHAGALLIGSRSFALEVEENHGVSPDVFTVVPGAVNCERFSPRESWRAGELMNPDEPVFLYHGRVDRRKGALDTLSALQLLRERGRKFRLLVSGIGPDFDAVREKIEELNAHSWARMLGYVEYENVPDVYHQGDVFLSPTYAEGFSNTILEAMASGLTCVSCFAVGVVDCLRDGENGLLVQPGDVVALARAIEHVLDEPELRAHITQKAFEEANTLYAWPTIAKQIEGIYERLIGTKPDLDFPEEFPVDASCRFRQAPHLL